MDKEQKICLKELDCQIQQKQTDEDMHIQRAKIDHETAKIKELECASTHSIREGHKDNIYRPCFLFLMSTECLLSFLTTVEETMAGVNIPSEQG